jgi:drug/metabolite transporter (DMT)-like permease
MTPRTATLIGLTAILMWSLLSVLTVATGKIPAFQLAAMTFAIGAAVAFASFLFRPSAFGALKQPPVAWVVGVGGLFGYHALYFLALRFAPPAEAGLLNYLWPLLIVLFSSLLPGERLASHHIIGALLGLAGTVLLLAGNTGGGFAPSQLPGLAAAFLAACVWAAYSVMSRTHCAPRWSTPWLTRPCGRRRWGSGLPSSHSALARWGRRSLSGTSA